MHDDIENMSKEEHMAYADIICNGFKASELEALENCADYFFEKVDNGAVVNLFDQPLTLDVVRAYEDDAQ